MPPIKMPSWGRGIANYGAHDKPLVGDTKTTAVGEDHLGWLLCDGRLLNPTDFQNLYKVIGYKFGRAGPLFRLPDPAGRVLGMIGTPNAANPPLTTRLMGGLSGEEMHRLVIPEMPSHTHDISYALTGIYIDSAGAHTHSITDTGHSHSISLDDAGSTSDAVGSGTGIGRTDPAYTNGNTTGISINSAGIHNHILHDPRHSHIAYDEGGDEPHNNIQPTLWVGNLFIYSGKTGFNRAGVYSGAFPNTAGTALY